ncbi:acyl carrier protein [Streptomyces sp. URMC 123]|uniref:acyl carrier protein n=1 Tax=Streptomyces sp. URMC 123 TaxID=3423403 RepID=UPI003F1B5FC9
MSTVLQQQIVNYLVDRLGLLPEEITPQARFKEDLELDSLDMVELVSLMEGELQVEVSDSAAERLKSLADVVSYLEERGAGAGEDPAAGTGTADRAGADAAGRGDAEAAA